MFTLTHGPQLKYVVGVTALLLCALILASTPRTGIVHRPPTGRVGGATSSRMIARSPLFARENG